jgi:hypothetical protein
LRDSSGLGVLFLWHHDKNKQLRIIKVLILIFFVLFGLSDFIESGTKGQLPAFLWWSKLAIGAVLYILLNAREHFFHKALTVQRIVIRIIMGIGLLAMYCSLTL